MSIDCGAAESQESTSTDLVRGRRSFFVLWGLPLMLFPLAAVVPAYGGALTTMALFWIGAACTANALRCRRVHCSIMGPAFLVLGLLNVGRLLGWVPLSGGLMTLAIVGSVVVAYTPEWLGKQYFRAPAVR